MAKYPSEVAKNKNITKLARQNMDQKSRKRRLITQDIACEKILPKVLRVFFFDALTPRVLRDDPRHPGLLAPYLSSATSFGDDFFLPAIMPFYEAFVCCL